MKKFWKSLGLILTLGATLFFIRSVLNLLRPERAEVFELFTLSFAGLALGVFLQITICMTGAIAWHFQLVSSGHGIKLRDSTGLFLTSQFAKYLPGNVGHFVGRVSAASRFGISGSKVTFILLIEASLGILAAVSVTAPALWRSIFSGETKAAGMPHPIEMTGLVLLALALPWLFATVINRWRPGPFRKLLGENPIVFPAKHVLFAQFASSVLTQFLFGIIVQAMVWFHFSSHPVPGVFQAAGISALAWVTGFLLPGAPAGLGVRDSMLTVSLTSALGYQDGVAVAVALLTRASTLGGDLLSFVLGWTLLRGSKAVYPSKS